MPATFAPTSPGDLPTLQAFLRQAFRVTGPLPANLQDPALHWKALEAHPWWPEGRGYLLRSDDQIAAHGIVTPVRFQWGGLRIESGQVVDWASGPLVPGGGMLIYRHCLQKTGGTLLAISGSADTRKILPQMKWFHAKADLAYFARPIRPWRYAVPATAPRAWARAARAFAWSRRALPGAHAWTCRLARPAEEVFQPGGPYVAIERSRAWFDYLASCPLASVELFILEHAGKACGHALVSHAAGCARLADFVALGEPAESANALAALVRHLSKQPRVSEILAASTLPHSQATFAACGFQPRGTAPVWVADPRKLAPPEVAWEINLAIGDAYYFHDPANPLSC